MNRSRMMQKTLLTPIEASQWLSVSVRTIYWWYAMGKIDGINITGRTLRIFRTSLQRLTEMKVLETNASVKSRIGGLEGKVDGSVQAGGEDRLLDLHPQDMR
jgi:excisionase family DNA binding protein